jgi:LysM repeat protein
MKTSLPRPLLWVALLMTLVGASGCWINLNAEAQPTPVAQDLPTQTFTPTLTEAPSETPTEEPVPETEEFVIPTEEPTLTETPEGITEVAQLDPTDDGSIPIEDPFVLSATALVATATQEIIDQTATAAVIFNLTNVTTTFTPENALPFVTLTPTTDPNSSFPPVTGGDCVHQVSAGENLFRIGLRYGVPLADLAARNGITNVNFIVVGQRITIPGCGTTGQLPPPTSDVVPAPNPNTGGGSSTCGPQYVVEQGDTLFQISLRCNVPVRTIAAASGVQNINLIFIDQVLTIP